MAATEQDENVFDMIILTNIHEIMEEGDVEEDDDMENDMIMAVNILQEEAISIREPSIRIPFYAERTVLMYNDEHFQAHFRINRNSFAMLLAAVGNMDLIPTSENHFNGGRPPIKLDKQLLVTLWYVANQCCMRDVADRFNITKSSIKRTVARVLEVVRSLSNEFIFWPTGAYKDSVIKGFYEMKRIKGVIGLIDGSHLEIPMQSQDKAAYINRKGFPSIVLQGICDHELKFTNINVGFPGSVHDARVLRRSQIYLAAENPDSRELVFPDGSFLLEDPAYPCLPWLMPPFKDTGRLNRPRRSYNYKVSATRVHIERAFGQLKGRFRKLRMIDMVNLKAINTLVIACCVIHNICISQNDVFEGQEEEEDNDPNHFEGIYNNDADGSAKRDQIVEMLSKED